MRFQFGGKEYLVEFSRDFKRVKTVGSDELVESRWPWTTVSIVEVDPEEKDPNFWKVLAKAETSCLPEDRFEIATGRLTALRKLTGFKRTAKGDVSNFPEIPKEMRRLIWSAYMNRPQAGKESKQSLLAEIDRLKLEIVDLKKQLWKVFNEEGE